MGDSIFAAETLALAWFVFGLKTGWSLEKKHSTEKSGKLQMAEAEE